MKFLITLFLLVAVSAFGAVPAYTSFKGTAGIIITSNPPTGDITISGAGVFTSSGTNATISTSTNGVIVAFASTNINFVRGTNVVLTATNVGSVTHIGIHAVGGQSSSMILSNLIGTVGRNVTNVISLSTSNATSKPITNSYANGVLTLFGLEAGANVTVTPNGSNLVITAIGGGPGGDSGAIQFNQDDTFAGTNRLNYDRTNEILYVAGSVGIGTPSPTYTLDVQAVIGSQRIVSTTSANETWLTFINNGAALIGLESSVPGTIVAGSSAYSLLLANQYAYPVQLATDNAVRMTILPTSGNVGIGTVSPTNTLDVQGHTSLRSNLFLPNLPTNGSPVAVLAVDAAGKVYETAVPAGGGSSVAPPISSVQFNSNGVQQGSANFTFTNNQVYINNPGAVGSAQLRLENTTQAAAWDVVIDSNPETYFLGIRNGTSYTTVWEPAGNVGIGTTNPANRLDVEGRMAIGAAYSGTSIAPTDGLIVVGNTGIGTNTVGAQLHVRPATSGGNYVRIDDTNGTPRFQFRVFPTAPHIAGLWMGDVTAANYAMLSDGTNTEINGASSVLLEVAGFAVATVVSNGVGVNTSPTNMFDVNGHTSLRSNLFLANLPTNGSPIAFLAVDAAGSVYETAVPTGGGSTVAPPISSVQFNSNGVMQGSAGFVFTNGLVGMGTAFPLAALSISNATATTPLLRIMAGNNPTPVLTVNSNGNVGMGTASPVTLLANTSSSQNDGGVGMSISSLTWASAAAGYVAGYVSTTASANNNGLLAKIADVSTSSKLVHFLSGANLTRLVILGDGSVGIGTNAPAARLQVTADNSALTVLRVGTTNRPSLLTLSTNGGLALDNITASRIATWHSDKVLTNGATTTALLDNFFAMGITNIVAADANIVIRTNAGSLTISNSMAAGGGGITISANTNTIPFVNAAGTGLTTIEAYSFGSLTNPGFGFVPKVGSAVQSHGFGGLMVFANDPVGLVTIGHPNPTSDFAGFATALVVSNRFNTVGNFKNDMVKIEAVIVNNGNLQADSTMTRWRVWQAPSGGSSQPSTSSNDVAELTIGGRLTLAGGLATNNAAFTITTNNFALDTYYTNMPQRSWVSASIGMTNVLLTEKAWVGLYLDQDGDGTWERTGINVRLQGISALAGVEQLGAFLQPSARFIFTNLGTVANSSIEPNSSQWVKQ